MKKHKTNTMKKADSVRSMSWFLLFIFGFELLMPTLTYAGGPTQPEAQSFTPVSVSNMVDPFTGDFSYNLPLMDVEGYPINIAYNAGISMDQEASWVGLGWNLNVGSVDRALRGLPDDFNGDEIIKETNLKPSRTLSIDAGAGFEIFGKMIKKKLPPNNTNDTLIPKMNVRLGLSYNNFTGYSSNFSFGLSSDLLKSASHDLTAGFSLSGSSENGASFAPSLSYNFKNDQNDKRDLKLKSTVGTSFNSRAGLSQISYGFSASNKRATSNRVAKFAKNRLEKGLEGDFNTGLATYSPTASNSMKNLSMRGSIKFGPDALGADLSFDISFAYSSNWIPKEYKTIKSPSYGYLYLHNGQSKRESLLDFNRDNDGSFSKEMPYIGSAHLTNDIFSIKAQGISGSYKSFRTDIGYVFDPETRTISHDGSFGLEAGAGNAFKSGFDASYNRTSAKTGMWDGNSNQSADIFLFKTQKPFGYVRSPFIEASESAVDDDPFFTQYGDDIAVRFNLEGTGAFPKLRSSIKNGSSTFSNSDLTTERELPVKRNQLFSYITVGELKAGLGIGSSPVDLNVNAENHHIGEITQLGEDGRRYVFGLPAYNTFQQDVTFAVDKDLSSTFNDYSGLVTYPADAATIGNKYGRDNYFMSETKPAYAHSFMLTSVLSDDYIDSDDIKGPSINDQGGYVKFDYHKVANHKWRAPIEKNKAYFNEGMRSDLQDDKASYVFGEKELWYVKMIETKNYVAIFTLEEREDGRGVAGPQGGVSVGAPSSQLLRKISLYNRNDYEANPSTAVPIQEVHFEYSYELCKNYPGNINTGTGSNFHSSGKLTLTKIYFTYQHSKKFKQSPYIFTYSTKNPNYSLKSVDRWGNYKSNPKVEYADFEENVMTDSISNSEYPYSLQEKTIADNNASAWNLVNIKLPSGGEIMVEYESDDYAFVQHLPAMTMCPIVGVEGETVNPTIIAKKEISKTSDENVDIVVKVDPSITDASQFVRVGEQLYFRCLVELDDALNSSKRSTYEYVSGYGKVSALTLTSGLLKIGLQPEKLKDSENSSYSPITKSAIQFGRMYLSKTISSSFVTEPTEATDEAGIIQMGKSIVNAFASYGELFTGPNKAIWNKERMRKIVTQKSFVRLRNPNQRKLGGGHRVKRILMKDNWQAMAGGLNQINGQEFKYINEDGTSSGVASYEPQLGGDENPWHQPVEYSNKKRFAADENLYVELPIMESLFPSPTVGYGRVEIKDIVVPNGTLSQPIAQNRGTGKVVKEFFTAKDFPTFVEMTDLYSKTATSFLPYVPSYQFSTVSQGFSIELNDMHGKPKSEKVFAEGNLEPISQVKYNYLSDDVVLNGFLVKKLKNQVATIDSKGNVSTHELGVKREAITDFRESNTKSFGGAMQFGVNGFFAFIPIIVPTGWPSVDMSQNRFRSASFNKITNRFGIQTSTEAIQDGSHVTTSNLAYDKETGEVLSTKTQTNFKDDVYSMNYPAYWKYDQLGQAYKNQGIISSMINLNSNGFGTVLNSKNYFKEGDELIIFKPVGVPSYGWVSTVSTNGINVIDKQGNPIEGDNLILKVYRSGYRNKQSTSMASIVTRENPIFSVKTNQYKSVLNAGAVEFGEDWKTYCKCFDGSVTNFASTNPYVLGTKGNWRPVRSLTHLTERTQSNYNGNTNIRNDGMFMSYTPYYKLINGKWDISPQNWTFVSEVTQFSPNGMTLETRDALNRYSATTFGFRNTLTTAVGVNTKYQQLGFESFEDAKDLTCYDRHFRFNGISPANFSSDAHTGKTSVRVTTASNISLSVVFENCQENNCSTLGLQNTVKEEVFQIVGGTAPYQVEYEVISGNAEVGISLPGNQLTISTQSSGYHEVEYQITDANGCILIKRFSITK